MSWAQQPNFDVDDLKTIQKWSENDLNQNSQIISTNLFNSWNTKRIRTWYANLDKQTFKKVSWKVELQKGVLLKFML